MKKLQSAALTLCCLTLVALICGANATFAQEVTATITGTVTDPSGSAVAGAAITAKSAERGISYSATTNDVGLYRISQLPVGHYDLKVEKTGFQAELYPTFALHENQVARFDVALKVGQVSQTIEVTGAAPVLKTEATQVDTIIDSATNDTLPLATRNYVQLTLLSPGVIHPDPSAFTSGIGSEDAAGNDGGRPFINGNREQSNNFLLDGMDNNQVSDNLVGYSPSPDSIQEFNLITNNAPAEFGNFMGGVVSATLKSGTNSFHGDIWEFFRNNVLNANQWENKINPSAALPRAPLRWNMFGGTLGGPIIKNKLFFFVDYQGQRFDLPPAQGFISVYTPAEQQGNFASLLNQATPVQLYNPCQGTTGQNGTPCVAATTRQPFPGNQIPVSMISPVAAALFASSLYPKTINNDLTNNAINRNGSNYNNNQGDIKIDYRISDKDQVSGRFTRAYQSDPISNSQPLMGNASSTLPIWSTVGDWTRAISNTLVNDMRFGWNHIILTTGSSFDSAIGNFGESIGIKNSNPNGIPGLLTLGLGGGTPSSVGSGVLTNLGNSLNNQRFNDQVWQFDDSVTKTYGRHTFKFGGEYLFEILNTFYSGNSGELGAMIFGANFTTSAPTNPLPNSGSGIADFFLGLPTSFGTGISSGGWIQTSNTYAGYAQDTWRITDHLTVNLGLRYEAHTPWIERNDHQVNYNMQTGNIDYANHSVSRSLYNGVYGGKDFQPRLGFAYTPGGRFAGRTVLRGAFTISDYLEGTGTNLRLPQNPPFSAPETLTQYLPPQPLPTTTASDGIVAPASGGESCSAPTYACYTGGVFRLWDPNVQPAISDQWNLTIQHQFGGTTTLQVGYVGQVGNHLMVPFKYNQLVAEPDSACSTAPCTKPSPFLAANPAFAAAIDSTGGTISGTQSNGRMMYNALQAVLQKTMSNGLQYQLSYTYSKCMSNNTGYYGTWSNSKQSTTAQPYWQNVYDPKAEWAPCYYDSTNVLSAYAIYDLPFGKGKQFGNDMNRAADAIVGGWTVSPILSLHSGFPLALYPSGPDPTGTLGAGLRPDCNGTNTVYGRRAAPAGLGGGFLWFDPSNYTNSTSGFGTCAPQLGRLRGPGYYNWDISLQKNFPLSERFKLQFRADFLNAFNRVNLAAPNTNVRLANTGLVQFSQPARNIQFALKLYY